VHGRARVGRWAGASTAYLAAGCAGGTPKKTTSTRRFFLRWTSVSLEPAVVLAIAAGLIRPGSTRERRAIEQRILRDVSIAPDCAPSFPYRRCALRPPVAEASHRLLTGDQSFQHDFCVRLELVLIEIEQDAGIQRDTNLSVVRVTSARALRDVSRGANGPSPSAFHHQGKYRRGPWKYWIRRA